MVTENAAGELVQNFNLDGDVDDRDVGDADEVPSGTFVLCVAKAGTFVSGGKPDASDFTYYSYVRLHTRHSPPSQRS